MTESNPNSRLEALSDGVFAFAMTLLIVEIKIPPRDTITSTTELWQSIQHLFPAFFAFLLSFSIILITWVNHHATLKLVNKSSPPFVYANGFLLLTIVLIPFPTALVGEYLLTDHASPAVVLYTGVDALQAVSWILLTRTALGPTLLTRDEKSTLAMRDRHRKGYFAFVLYAGCTIVAFWFPLTMAILITAIWSFWLFVSVERRNN